MSANFGIESGGPPERRRSYPDFSPTGKDRRQFGANYDDLSPSGRELGTAIDNYKVDRHRRFITPAELLEIAASLGYRRDESTENARSETFVDRRGRSDASPVGAERRQFSGNYNELSPEGKRLADAIDQYKLCHRRRVVNPDELVAILQTAGYRQLVEANA
jgi:hypothetical protein